MTASLFNPAQTSTSAAQHDQDDKQRAFIRLKAVCVPLSAAARDDASTRDKFQTVINLLKRLKDELSRVPDAIFTPALANYVLFPLVNVLQPPPPPSLQATQGRTRHQHQSDTVIEHAMAVLEVLVRKWRLAGIDNRILHELWTMVILQLGGPLDPNGPTHNKASAKGKAVERTEECSLAMVKVLAALAGTIERPEQPDNSDDDEDALGADIDWTSTGAEPVDRSTEKQRAHVPAPPSPRTPIVFHTLTTVTELAARPSSLVMLQLVSLQVLETVLLQHLAKSDASKSGSGPAPLLATALPGTASTLCRTALSLPPTSSSADSAERARPQHSSVVVHALRLLTLLLLAAIGDDVTTNLRTHLESPPSLEDLQILTSTLSSVDIDDSHTKADPAPPSRSTTGPIQISPSWLKYTTESVSALLSSLGPLDKHDNPSVRQALANLLGAVLEGAFETLSSARELLIEGLLVLASDEWPLVSHVAEDSIKSTLDTETVSSGLLPSQVMVTIVKRRMTMLPNQLRKRNVVATTRSSKIIQSALQFINLVSADSRKEVMDSALTSVDSWSWNVLSAVQLDDSAAALSNSSAIEGRSQLAWINGSIDHMSTRSSWPTIKLRNDTGGENVVVQSLNDLWRSLGHVASLNDQEGVVIDSFLSTALGVKKWDESGSNALWALNGVLEGMQRVERQPLTKRRKKVVNNVVKSMISLLEELDQVVFDENEQDRPDTQVDSRDLGILQGQHDVVVEHARIISHTPALDGLKPVSASSTKLEDNEKRKTMLQCTALRVLSTSASILEQDFHPHLLQSLYHVLAHMSPLTNNMLRSCSQAALSNLATSMSYASAQNLVLANVDYVVNSVSQRLSVTHLDPDAPLVLVEMIRLVGQDIVPMVQDLVEDVFEALDDYHGYDRVTMSLWAVMDALMRVMGQDEKQCVDAGVITAMGAPQIKALVDSDGDWDGFVEWFARRKDETGETSADVPEQNPEMPFGAAKDDEQDEEPGMPSEPERAPATRHQTVASHIIAKATYFLSHHSPFLRARVLSLISTAVPLLVAQSQPDDATVDTSRRSDLLPVIHRAWPYIINRLSDKDYFVVIEAASLIESLSTHVGEFMSRRILDDVWPVFKTLIDKHFVTDVKLATTKGGLDKRYTVSHRLYLSVLRTVTQVVKHVPIKEDVSWQMCLSLRRFLMTTSGDEGDDEVQTAAVALFGELARLKPDCVWIVLNGARGQCGLPVFLEMKGQMSQSVDKVLCML
ncbi:hypothetical protein ACM66B_001695 [Microbotryomycetes sp. NB124-2]